MTELHSRRRYFLKWPIILVVLLLALCPASAFLRIGLAEAQWQIFKPNRYHLVMESVGAWDIEGTVVDSEIQDERIINQTCGRSLIGKPTPMPCSRSFLRSYTVSDLFAYIWRKTYRGASGNLRPLNCLSVSYHPILGYPTSISQDCKGVMDDELQIYVKVESTAQ